MSDPNDEQQPLATLPTWLSRIAVVLAVAGAAVAGWGTFSALSTDDDLSVIPYVISGVIGGSALLGLGGITWWARRAIIREQARAAQFEHVTEVVPHP